MPDRTPRLSDESLAFLRSRQWKGNVRELQNVIEHVAVLVDPERVIEPDDIPIYDDDDGAAMDAPTPVILPDEAYHMAKDRIIAHFEKDYLARLISRAGGNMSKAARLAKVDRTTLYRLMEKHSILREEETGAVE
jgi:DNA-binding NtrC family response regulator